MIKVAPPTVPNITVDDLIASEVPLQRILDPKQWNKKQRYVALQQARAEAKKNSQKLYKKFWVVKPEDKAAKQRTTRAESAEAEAPPPSGADSVLSL